MSCMHSKLVQVCVSSYTQSLALESVMSLIIIMLPSELKPYIYIYHNDGDLS